MCSENSFPNPNPNLNPNPNSNANLNAKPNANINPNPNPNPNPIPKPIPNPNPSPNPNPNPNQLAHLGQYSLNSLRSPVPPCSYGWPQPSVLQNGLKKREITNVSTGSLFLIKFKRAFQ